MSKNKQEKFLALYEPIHDRFECFCRVRVYGNMDYQDLMNDTLLIAFEKFEKLKSEKAFLSFLFGISVRLLANHKKKKKEVELQKVENANLYVDFDSNSSLEAELHFLYVALSQLNSEQRESLILFEISGFSIKEISVIQNVSESAIKQRLKRGRERLTEIITFESSFKTGEVYHG